MNYELLVGLRYTRAKRRNHFVSFISAVSMSGIALGVAALIVVLSVVNGFEREFRARILGITAHVQLLGFDGLLRNWEQASRIARSTPGVVSVAPFVNAQGMLSLDGTVRGVVLRGIDPALERHVAQLDEHMQAGRIDDLAPGRFGVVLGTELAKALGVGVGGDVTLIAPQGVTDAGMIVPRLRQLEVIGLFQVGMFEYDSQLALMHIEDTRTLFSLQSGVTGLRLKLEDPFRSRVVAAALGRDVPGAFANEWSRTNANLFRAVQTSKTMVVIVVALLIAIAAFNIVASLVMAVADKQSDIAILRTQGASPGAIQRIFMIQGVAIGMIGTLAGVLIGVAVALNVTPLVNWVEARGGFRFLAPEVYHITELPSDLVASDVLITAGVALLLSVIATLYPSRRAAKLRPVEALRYE